MGQNIRTLLAQSGTDELHVPFESVRMVLGDTDLTPYHMGIVGNAILDATGLRLTSLPLTPRGFKTSGAVVWDDLAPTSPFQMDESKDPTTPGWPMGVR